MSGNCATGMSAMAMTPHERDDDGDDRGEPRPIDENVGEHRRQRPGGGAADTTWPGRTFWMPSMMTARPA